MKKITKKSISYLSVLLMMLIMGAQSISAWDMTYNKYYTSAFGSGNTTYLKAYVQVKPSVNDGGYHYARGWLCYTSAYAGVSNVYKYTGYGSSASDTTIYSTSVNMVAIRNGQSFSASATFGAEKIPEGAIWPY